MDETKINRRDWALLMEQKDGRLYQNVADHLKEDEERLARLRQAGVLEEVEGQTDQEGLYLTDAGLEKVKSLQKRLIDLRQGVDFSKRRSKKVDLASLGDWAYGTYRRKKWLTNGHVLLVDDPPKLDVQALAEKGGPTFYNKLRKHVSPILSDAENYEQIQPVAWQMDRLDGLEIVWLANESRSVRVAIQGEYFDVIQQRFPTALLFGRDEQSPVRVWTTRRGIGYESTAEGGVVGLVMPCVLVHKGKAYLPYPKQVLKGGGSGEKGKTEDV